MSTNVSQIPWYDSLLILRNRLEETGFQKRDLILSALEIVKLLQKFIKHWIELHQKLEIPVGSVFHAVLEEIKKFFNETTPSDKKIEDAFNILRGTLSLCNQIIPRGTEQTFIASVTEKSIKKHDPKYLDELQTDFIHLCTARKYFLDIEKKLNTQKITETLIVDINSDKSSVAQSNEQTPKMAINFSAAQAIQMYTSTDSRITPEDFLRSVEVNADVEGWNEEIKIKIAKSRLMGRALRKIQESIELNNAASWAEFKILFIKRFRAKKPIAQAKSDMVNCSQKPTESVDEFEDRFSTIARQAFEESNDPVENTLREKMHADDKRIYFINGLKPSLRQALHIKTPNSYEKAIEMAREQEALMGSTRSCTTEEEIEAAVTKALQKAKWLVDNEEKLTVTNEKRPNNDNHALGKFIDSVKSSQKKTDEAVAKLAGNLEKLSIFFTQEKPKTQSQPETNQTQWQNKSHNVYNSQQSYRPPLPAFGQMQVAEIQHPYGNLWRQSAILGPMTQPEPYAMNPSYANPWYLNMAGQRPIFPPIQPIQPI